MNFFNLLDEINDSNKQDFARYWERWHRKGLVRFLLFIAAMLMLLSLFRNLIGLIFRPDLLATETWTHWAAQYDWRFEAFLALSGGPVFGLILWFGCEEMYRNFKD